MKAIQVHEFGPPEVMKLEEVQDPRPGKGQVLVRMKAVGVNPVETYIRAGAYFKKEFPYTPGSDGAGVVEAIGEGVEAFSPGDKIYTAGSLTGTYAELALCSVDQVKKLPDVLSFAEGACVGVPYATAYRALFHKAKAAAGESVLVHGATGGVGIAAVQLARAFGLRVIGTGSTVKGRELVMKEGAHHVLDHKDTAHLEKAASIAGGGVDIIIEFLANVNLGADLLALSRKGRVIVVGSRGTIEIDPRDLMSREASIRGMSLFNASQECLKSIHQGLIAGFEARTLRPVVGKELPLAEAVKAHHMIIEESAYGKIVLIP